MGLMKETRSAAIDTTAIHPGDLIRAKYADWNEAKNGIVTAVTGGEIRCLYFSGYSERVQLLSDRGRRGHGRALGSFLELRHEDHPDRGRTA